MAYNWVLDAAVDPDDDFGLCEISEISPSRRSQTTPMVGQLCVLGSDTYGGVVCIDFYQNRIAVPAMASQPWALPNCWWMAKFPIAGVSADPDSLVPFRSPVRLQLLDLPRPRCPRMKVLFQPRPPRSRRFLWVSRSLRRGPFAQQPSCLSRLSGVDAPSRG